MVIDCSDWIQMGGELSFLHQLIVSPFVPGNHSSTCPTENSVIDLLKTSSNWLALWVRNVWSYIMGGNLFECFCIVCEKLWAKSSDKEHLLIPWPPNVIKDQGWYIYFDKRFFDFGYIPNEEFSLLAACTEEFSCFIESNTIHLVLVSIYSNSWWGFLWIPNQHWFVCTPWGQQVSVFGVIKGPHSLFMVSKSHRFFQRGRVPNFYGLVMGTSGQDGIVRVNG